MNQQKAYTKFIISLLIFGSNGTIASLISLTSYEIVFMRTLIGSLFLLAVMLIKKFPLAAINHKKDFLLVSVSGALMGISWIFLYEAYNTVGVSLATLIYYCGPVFVMALSPVLFKEKFTATKTAGFFTVILGMTLINLNSFVKGSFSSGMMLSLFGAFCFTGMTISNKKNQHITGIENTTIQLLSAFAVTTVFMSLKYGIDIHITKSDIIPVLFIGFVNTGFGCFLYFSSLQMLNTQTISVCGYLEPLSALIFSAIFLREHLGLIQLMGAALILGGSIIGEVLGQNVHVEYKTIHVPYIKIARNAVK